MATEDEPKPDADPSKPAKPARKSPAKKGGKQRKVYVLKTDEAGLNYQRRQFLFYFLGKSNGNATDAARRAGYSDPTKAGYRLSRNVQILAGVQAHLNECSLSTEEILSRLSDIATCSLGDFIVIDSKGGFRVDLAKAVRSGKLHCLKTIRLTAYGYWIELHDAMAALDKLARYRGLYAERPVDVNSGVEPLNPDAAKAALQAAAGELEQGALPPMSPRPSGPKP